MPARDLEHRLGAIEPDDPGAPRHELTGDPPRPRADLEHPRPRDRRDGLDRREEPAFEVLRADESVVVLGAIAVDRGIVVGHAGEHRPAGAILEQEMKRGAGINAKAQKRKGAKNPE